MGMRYGMIGIYICASITPSSSSPFNFILLLILSILMCVSYICQRIQRGVNIKCETIKKTTRETCTCKSKRHIIRHTMAMKKEKKKKKEESCQRQPSTHSSRAVHFSNVYFFATQPLYLILWCITLELLLRNNFAFFCQHPAKRSTSIYVYDCGTHAPQNCREHLTRFLCTHTRYVMLYDAHRRHTASKMWGRYTDTHAHTHTLEARRYTGSSSNIFVRIFAKMS